jgi:hypothetical protein
MNYSLEFLDFNFKRMSIFHLIYLLNFHVKTWLCIYLSQEEKEEKEEKEENKQSFLET